MAAGNGVTVRLLGDTLVAQCGKDAELGVVISNNSEEDIYIPISRELEGDRIKLYPWRLSYDSSGSPFRLARQLQYNDVLERLDALLRFFRLPAGREVALQGVIPQRWLCSAAREIAPPYLNAELNPVFYSDRVRSLRDAEYHRDPNLPSAIGLRYDVAYTTLRYLESLPVTSRNVNSSGDTVQVMVGIKEEPGGDPERHPEGGRKQHHYLEIPGVTCRAPDAAAPEHMAGHAPRTSSDYSLSSFR